MLNAGGLGDLEDGDATNGVRELGWKRQFREKDCEGDGVVTYTGLQTGRRKGKRNYFLSYFSFLHLKFVSVQL